MVETKPNNVSRRKQRRMDEGHGPSLGGPRNRITAGDWFLVLFFILMIIVTFLPMVNLLARSFSDPMALVFREVGLLPVGWNLRAYRIIFNDPVYFRQLWFTIYLTVTAVIVSMTLTILAAYPMSYDNLKGRRVFMILVILTMYFSAGMIPNFMLIRDLGLLNNFWVLIIPNAISVFNIILMRSFFFGIPPSLRESAEVEGANPFQILVKIYLPLSTPVLATISLFYAVGRWNGFTDALLYIGASHRNLYPIQLLLWELMQGMTNVEIAAAEGVAGAGFGGLNESIRAATIMISTVPILLVYPWLQRFFISGATLGAVKE